MIHFKKIVGDICYLSPVDNSEAEKVGKWSNDIEIASRTGDISDMITFDEQRKYLENMNHSKGYAFFIIRLSDDEVIGIARLLRIDFIHKKAIMGMFIGEKNNRSKGVGTEATNLLLDYAFNVLNLNNVMVETYSFNTIAIKTLKKCGFKEIGRRRQSILYGSDAYDEVFMDLLSDEFEFSRIKEMMKI